MKTISEVEREQFFAMMRQLHSDKELRSRVVADIRELAADPAWCAERSAELRKRVADADLLETIS